MTAFTAALTAVWPTAVAILVLGFLVGFSAFVVFSEQATRKAAAEADAIEARAAERAARQRKQATRAKNRLSRSPANQRRAAAWFATDRVDWLDDDLGEIRAAEAARHAAHMLTLGTYCDTCGTRLSDRDGRVHACPICSSRDAS